VKGVLNADSADSLNSCIADLESDNGQQFHLSMLTEWLGSRVVSVLDSGAEGPGFKSQPRRCRVTVLGILCTPIVPLFTKQRKW